MNSRSTSEDYYKKLATCVLEVQGRMYFKNNPSNGYFHAERFPEKNLLVHSCVLLYDKYNQEAGLHLQTGMNCNFMFLEIKLIVCHSSLPEDKVRCKEFNAEYNERKKKVCLLLLLLFLL
jgi:hypothetical protein